MEKKKDCGCKGKQQANKVFNEINKIEGNILEEEKSTKKPLLTVFFNIIAKIILAIIGFSLGIIVTPILLMWVLINFILGKPTKITNPTKWFSKNGK